MPRLPRRVAWLLFATVALAVAGALVAKPTSIQTASAAQGARPRVTNRCRSTLWRFAASIYQRCASGSS
jgi:hypothetical protein